MAQFLDLRQGVAPANVAGAVRRGQLADLENARNQLLNQQQQMTNEALPERLKAEQSLRETNLEQVKQQITQAAAKFNNEQNTQTMTLLSGFGRRAAAKIESGDMTPEQAKASMFKMMEASTPQTRELWLPMIESMDDTDFQMLAGGLPGAKLSPQEEADLRVQTEKRIEAERQKSTRLRQERELSMAGDKRSAEEVAKRTAESVVADQDKALTSKQALYDSQVAMNLLDKGIFSGTAADFRLGVGRLAKTFGLWDDSKSEVANTEAFMATMGKQTAAVITAFGAGTGLSDADREYAQMIAGGKIGMSEEGLRRIIEINRRANLYKISEYLNRVDQTYPGEKNKDQREQLKGAFSKDILQQVAKFRENEAKVDVAFTYHPALKRDVTVEEVNRIAKDKRISYDDAIKWLDLKAKQAIEAQAAARNVPEQ